MPTPELNTETYYDQDPLADLEEPLTSGKVTLGLPTETVLPAGTPVHTTPFEENSEDKKYLLTLKGPDGSFIANRQIVDPDTRLMTQLLFDTAKEKISFLSKRFPTYDIAQHPSRPYDVIMKPKGGKRWGVVDPGGASVSELWQEAQENVDSLVQAAILPESIVLSALGAGGVQAARQAVKKYFDKDSEFSGSKVAADAAVGAFAPALVKGGTYAIGKLATKADGTFLRTREALGDLAGKTQKAVNLIDTPETLLKDIGAGAKDFDPFLDSTLKKSASWLQSNAKDLWDGVRNSFTLKGKYDVLKNAFDEAGDTIGKAYRESDIDIPLKHVFESDDWKALKDVQTNRTIKQGEKALKVDEKVAARSAQVRHSTLEQFATTLLGDEGTQPILQAFRKGKLHKFEYFKDLGFKTNDDAMEFALQGSAIPVDTLWGVKQYRDSLVNYARKKGAIQATHTTEKLSPDAIRAAIVKGINEADPALGAELEGASEAYHNLYPLVRQAGRTLGQDSAADTNLLKYWFGSLNSPKRRVAMLANKVLNSTWGRAAIRNLSKGKTPLPEVTLPSAEAASQIFGPKDAARGLSFLSLKYKIADQVLPREAEAYFGSEDNGAFNDLVSKIDDPELADALARQQERGDVESFANTLSAAASGNEALFAPAPYKSLVTKGGRPIITDKYDRQAYRTWVQKNVPDAAERYQILNSMNFDNEMVKPPFEMPKTLQIKQGKKSTGLSRITSDLKSVPTVELDDGSERVDYDR